MRNEHCAYKYLFSKAFTLFCREFGNVVNRAFLVLIFLAKKAVGASLFAFCNYEHQLRKVNTQRIIFTHKQTSLVFGLYDQRICPVSFAKSFKYVPQNIGRFIACRFVKLIDWRV